MRFSVALVSAFALALTVSATVTACSSSSNGKGTAIGAGSTSAATTAATSSSGSSSSSSSAGSTAALDAAKLKALLLTKNDVPSGWTPSPASPTTASDKAEQAKLTACLGVPDPDAHKVAEADSDDYSLNDSQISSSATSYPSQADVDQGVAVFSNPKAPGCYKQGFKDAISKEMPAGSTVDKLDVTITPGTNGGPANVVAKADAEMTVTAQGQTLQFVINTYFIKGRLIGAEVDFFGVGGPIDQAIQSTALKAVADRVAAA